MPLTTHNKPLPRTALEPVCEALANVIRQPGMERLTPREREILILLAQGGYYREIGESLGISAFTVRAHLHSVYKKLGVNSRGRAVVKFHEYNQIRQNRRTKEGKENSNVSRNTNTHFMQPTRPDSPVTE